jgi:bifunctional DNase/RNase
MVPVRVLEIACSADHQRTLIVLEDLAQRFRITFAADVHEARRLAREMGRARCTCNPVYDFIQSLLGTFEATISRVIIDDLDGKGIGAVICLQRAEGALSLPCYPPDALALALRAKVPVYASLKVLAHAQRLTAPGTFSPGPTEVRQWLEGVRPENF